MTELLLIISMVLPLKWSVRRVPINTPQTCWSSHLVRLHECAVQYPDATSIQRGVCEAESRGQYTACVEGVP